MKEWEKEMVENVRGGKEKGWKWEVDMSEKWGNRKWEEMGRVDACSSRADWEWLSWNGWEWVMDMGVRKWFWNVWEWEG